MTWIKRQAVSTFKQKPTTRGHLTRNKQHSNFDARSRAAGAGPQQRADDRYDEEQQQERDRQRVNQG